MSVSLGFGLLARLYFHNLHYEKFHDGTVKCIEDEIPFELPEGWEWCRLFQISEIITGSTPSKKNSEYYGNECPFFKPNDLEQGANVIHASEYLSTEGKKVSRVIPSGSTAVCCIGSIGKCGYLQKEGTTNQQINSIVPYIHKKFVFYYCLTNFFVEQLLLEASATTIAIVNKNKMSNVFIPVPPLSEQEEISKKLDTLIRFIDEINLEKESLAEAIQQTKSKILDLAIRGKLVPQNPDDEPASVLLDRISAEKEELIKQGKIKRDKKESVIFRGDDNSYYEKISDTVICIDEELPFDIPDNWVWARLSSACIINPRNNIADDMAVSFVPMTMIQDGFANKYTFEQRKWVEVKKGFTHFAENDVGFAKITPCFENRKSVVFRGLLNGYGAGTTELYILRTFPDTIIPEYILYIVKTESFLVGGKQTCAGVVGQQRISKDYVCDYLVPVPPLNEQVRIINKCTEIMTMLHNIEKSLS